MNLYSSLLHLAIDCCFWQLFFTRVHWILLNSGPVPLPFLNAPPPPDLAQMRKVRVTKTKPQELDVITYFPFLVALSTCTNEMRFQQPAILLPVSAQYTAHLTMRSAISCLKTSRSLIQYFCACHALPIVPRPVHASSRYSRISPP